MNLPRCLATLLALSLAAVSAAEPALVGVLGTIPSPEHTALVNALRAAAPERYTAESATTFADPALTRKTLEGWKARGVRALVACDPEAARAISAVGEPARFVVIPDEHLLTAGEGEESSAAWWKAPRVALIETSPEGAEAAAVLMRLQPPPPRVGLTYTIALPPAEHFRDALADQLPALASADIDSTSTAAGWQCRLDPGACRNVHEVRSGLEAAFGTFPRGSMIVVYPDSNTVKFSHAFTRFARERELVLVGVGTFRPAGCTLRIERPAATIAARMIAALDREAAGEAFRFETPEFEAAVEEELLRSFSLVLGPEPARP